MAHKVTIKELSHDQADSYSPNLHRWLSAHGTGRREGAVVDLVYRVKADSKLAEQIGVGTLVIGQPYNGYEGDNDVSGVRLMEVLCNGTKADRVCLVNAVGSLEPISDFWERYQQVGRCAIDPDHKEHFVRGERYTFAGQTKTCNWCGAELPHVD